MQQLRSVFEEYGGISDVNIPVHQMTQQSRGFAFVEYKRSMCADMCARYMQLECLPWARASHGRKTSTLSITYAYILQSYQSTGCCCTGRIGRLKGWRRTQSLDACWCRLPTLPSPAKARAAVPPGRRWAWAGNGSCTVPAAMAGILPAPLWAAVPSEVVNTHAAPWVHAYSMVWAAWHSNLLQICLPHCQRDEPVSVHKNLTAGC